MEDGNKASIPPAQTEGFSKELEEKAEFDTLDDAEEFFILVKDRLLDINNWHKVSDSIKSEFHIVDSHGKEHHRHAHKGDYVRIKIPGPKSDTGDGADWVQVDAIEYDDYPDENKELIALRLRPVSNPTRSDDAVAHFFTDASSSTFIIERDHKLITAHYYGRNEKPNTGGETVKDTVRNVAVAVGALLGFSDVQWKGLLTGFLDDEK